MPETKPAGERIAKRLARAGLCSRREAERWIAAGRVSVDGIPLTTPAVTVGAGAIVTVDGSPIPAPPPPRLWRYHKPPGLITSHRDPQGRPTLFAALPLGMPRVISVGRLDIASEGLLLLTTDGALARRLELPRNRWLRRYRVRVRGDIDRVALARLAEGLTIDGIAYRPIAARLDRGGGGKAWLTISLCEGKNREVRRVLGHLGLSVTRLIRTAFGPFRLGRLAPGAPAEVPADLLREKLAAANAADTGFDPGDGTDTSG